MAFVLTHIRTAAIVSKFHRKGVIQVSMLLFPTRALFCLGGYNHVTLEGTQAALEDVQAVTHIPNRSCAKKLPSEESLGKQKVGSRLEHG